MSLINDALKRAETAPREPLTEELTLRAAEPHMQKNRVPRLILVCLVVLLAAVTVFWVLRANQVGVGFGSLQARARTAEVPKAIKHAPAALPTEEVPQPAIIPAPASTPVPLQTAAPADQLNGTRLAAQTDQSLQPAPAVTQAQPAPPSPAVKPFKLQSIVYSQQPSAMISGSMVYQGEMFREYRVTKITRGGVELQDASETIYLTLK